MIGRYLGQLLSDSNQVFYASRSSADFYLDLNASDFDVFGGRKFDVIIHLAAHFGGVDDESIKQAELVNCLGTLAVCQFAHQIKVKHLIVISSISANYHKDNPNFSIYALSKRHAEELANYYSAQKKIPLTILRPSQIYDSESNCRKHQKLIYRIIDSAQDGRNIQIYGNNDALRDLLHISDFAEIIRRVISKKVFGSFDCTAVNPIRLSEIAGIAYKVFGNGGKLQFVEDQPDIPDIPRFESQSLYEKIHYFPETEFHQGIKKLKQYRESA